MGPVLPLHLFLPNQSEIGFMDKRRRLQRVAGLSWPETAARQPMQFAIDQRQQMIQRVLIAIALGHKELCHFRG